MSCSQVTIESTDHRARPLPALSRADRCRDDGPGGYGPAMPGYRNNLPVVTGKRGGQSVRSILYLFVRYVPREQLWDFPGYPRDHRGFHLLSSALAISQQRQPDYTGLPVPDVSYRHGTGEPEPFALTGTEHHTHQAELPTCNDQ